MRLGARVRGLRRRERLTQAQLAERLGISPSYLNLIENDRRPLPSALLIKLAQLFKVDLDTFGGDEHGRTTAALMEVFSDPLFEPHDLTTSDVSEIATASPATARAVLTLYRAYQSARDATETLASRLFEGDGLVAMDRSRLPPEEVSELIQRRMNYFPELEAGAEELWRAAKLSQNDLYSDLVRHLMRAHHVEVRIAQWRDEPGTLRRYDPERRVLTLSELLPTRSRSFQVAQQIALLSQTAELDRIAADPQLTNDESRALARMALASYFAGAVLMPYGPFLAAARSERYDLDVIGRRFRVGFEQVCHRLTTLRRPGAEGVPFHMIRTDVAGNISKRFSGSGIRMARFSGACPRWNIFAAFSTPGMVRVQISRMPDGLDYFCIARTVQKDSGGYHDQSGIYAIGLGCQLQHAKEMVYADGVDLEAEHAIVPVGVTCRVCERTECPQRTLPSLHQPLHVDPNTRRITLYTAPPQ
ncbi:short-chain fatty acyl-CoA regulator family protein [Myxococcota bacterium]|nr:short-chain fatty acyl-CoA regulator family protein [Myxococcota bacterium]